MPNPMRAPAIAVALTLALGAATAAAQDTRPRADTLVMPRGPYIGGAAGASFLSDDDVRFGAVDSKTKYNVGPAGLVTLGYGFPFGLRLEVEGGYRFNGVDEASGADGDGRLEVASAMLNAIYDVPLPTFGIPVTPHLGVGVGWAHLWNRSLPHGPAGTVVKGQDDVIAFQGIAGVDYVISPQLVAGIDYRYFVAHNASFDVVGGGNAQVGDVASHTVLATLRWYFTAPPAPAPVPVVAPPPAAPAAAPAGPRLFSVFFDFDRSELSPEAQPIIAEAARYAREGGVSRIMVTGHADRAGPASYNQTLSERRAESVRRALVREGISEAEITTVGRGETEPAVPTPDGVREPRNRRVEIVLQSAGA